jgi:hypothetical protein
VHFSISYPWWFILLCLLVGAVYATILYAKNGIFSKGISWLLALLRFLTGSIISFLLLSPVIKWMRNETLKPKVIVLQDNSASQNKAFEKSVNKAQFTTQLAEQIKQIEQFAEVKQLTYGTALRDTNALTYKEGGTDLGTALEQISSAYENENLGAIVVTGDGIMTQGANPASQTLSLNGAVYAIGIGDSTIQRDAMVLRTYQNKVAFLGDKFSVKIDALGLACNGANTAVTIYHHNTARTVGTQSFSFAGNKSSKQEEIIVDANAKGLQKYSAIISSVNGEVNTTNNRIDFYVDVLDSKQKVLLVCNAPHPDVNAIKEALSINKNTDLEIVTAEKLKQNPADYNLVILHNLPSVRYNLASFYEQIAKSGTGILYIVGSQTLLTQFNQKQNALNIKATSGGLTDIAASPNTGFNLFTMKPSELSKYGSLPPLTSPFGQYSAGANTSVLFNQKVGAVNTTYPLWLLQQTGTARMGVIAGEGIWRWRMYNFVQHNNFDLVDDAIQKTVQYLVVKQDKKPFRCVINKTINSTNESISFDAELYNDNYELITPNEVNLVISDGKSTRSNYTMNKQEKNYSINIGTLAAGDYQYEAKTNRDGKTFSEIGSFKVVDIDVETANTTADFNTLSQLANNYQGKFLYPSQTKDLATLLKKDEHMKNLVRSELNSDPLINWRWIFGVLITLLALEWFLRKRNGGY